MVKNKDIIDVIYEKDLQKFIENIGFYDDFKNNNIKCKFCQNLLSKDNICAILINEGKVDFICNDESCYDKLLIHQKGEKNV